jgi:ABC-type multidrug transport system fused ATPase/permease subunit
LHIPLTEYWRLLSKYLSSQKAPVALLGALVLFSIGLQLLIPQIFRFFVDQAKEGAEVAVLVEAAVFFVAVALVQHGSGVWTRYIALKGRLGIHECAARRPDASLPLAGHVVPQREDTRGVYRAD